MNLRNDFIIRYRSEQLSPCQRKSGIINTIWLIINLKLKFIFTQIYDDTNKNSLI